MSTSRISLVGTEPRTDIAERAQLFKEAMRRLASGIALITAGSTHEQYAGLVATAVNSLSMDPPTLLICVNKSGSAHPVIESTGAFCVNLLGEEDHALVDIFGSSSRRHERFETGRFVPTALGPPRLVTAMAAVACKVVQTFSYQTHTLFLGEVWDVELHGPDGVHPLIYLQRSFYKISQL